MPFNPSSVLVMFECRDSNRGRAAISCGPEARTASAPACMIATVVFTCAATRPLTHECPRGQLHAPRCTHLRECWRDSVPRTVDKPRGEGGGHLRAARKACRFVHQRGRGGVTSHSPPWSPGSAAYAPQYPQTRASRATARRSRTLGHAARPAGREQVHPRAAGSPSRRSGWSTFRRTPGRKSGNGAVG